jgi:hypothetical protein
MEEKTVSEETRKGRVDKYSATPLEVPARLSSSAISQRE